MTISKKDNTFLSISVIFFNNLAMTDPPASSPSFSLALSNPGTMDYSQVVKYSCSLLPTDLSTYIFIYL